MKKELSDMTDHELLLELVAEKRRQGKNRRVHLVLWLLLLLAVVILSCVYVPRVAAAIHHYNVIMDSVESTTERLNSSLVEYQSLAADAQAFFDEMKQLGLGHISESTQGVVDFFQGIGEYFGN